MKLPAILEGSPRWPIPVGRILLGIMWLASLRWKLPPDFEPSGETTGLREWLQREVDSPAFGFYGSLIESVVLPNFTLFAWLVFFTELGVGLALLLGLFVRPAALVGLLLSLNLWLGLKAVPGEWHWAYVLLAVWHLAVLLSHDSTVWSVRRWLPESLRRFDWPIETAGSCEPVGAVGAKGSPAAAVLRIGLGLITAVTWWGNVDKDFYDGDSLAGFFGWLFTPAADGGNGSSLTFVKSLLDATLLQAPDAAGWVLTIVELFIAVGLLLGVFTRAAALLAAGFFGSLFLSYFGGEEWIVVYVLLTMAAVVAFLGWGGRRFGLDQFVAAKRGESPATLMW